MRRPLLALFALALVGTGCFRALNPRDFSTSASLYRAGIEAYDRAKWRDAINAFERLTLDLPTRDTLLARAHWFLGQSRFRNTERLLSAQSFIRLTESFPDDTLADDALFMSGRAYAALWARPELDPQYGILAQTQFRLLLGVYPTSAFADSATYQLRRLDEMFAEKDYATGVLYIRRKAYDSGILYLREVVEQWPNTDKARLSMLRLVEVYRLPVMNYKQDAEEVCAALRAGFPTDPEVLRLCKLSPGDSTTVVRR
jgi:outer membrane assembly lipoprotein YfiO